MIRRTALLTVAAASLFMGTAAHADVFSDLSIRIGVGHRERAVQRVWVEPVYETRVDRVWVEPAYQTQVQHVWHEAVYEDRCDSVLVPDRFETRVETSRDYHGRTYRHEIRVLVEPAHYVQQANHVLVRDGYYEDVAQQVCLSEGHWAETSHQVVVREGYWSDQPVACATPGPDVHIGFDRVTTHDDHRDDRHDDRHDPRADRDDRIGRDHDGYDRGRRYER